MPLFPHERKESLKAMSTLFLTLLLCSLLFVATYVGGARAQTPGLAWFKDTRAELRQAANRARENRCRGDVHGFYLQAREVRRWRRDDVLEHWRDMRERARSQRSGCAPTIPAFPWLALASCESGQRWNYNGASGFDGGFQFLPSTWVMAGGPARGYAYAWQAPAYVQYLVARSWQARTSWAQWPVCAAKLGLL